MALLKTYICAFLVFTTISIQVDVCESVQCLQIMSASRCAKIQQSGVEIKTQILTIDDILKEAVERTLDEGASIMNGTLVNFKQHIKPMEISAPTVGMETDELRQVQKKIASVITNQIIAANHAMHDVIVEMSLTFSDGNDVVTEHLFNSTGVAGSAKIDVSNNKLGASLDGVKEAVMPHIQSSVVAMSQQIVSSFGLAFRLFVDSLKALFGDKVIFNFDLIKNGLDQLFKQSEMLRTLSTGPRLADAISEAAIHVDDINTMTSGLDRSMVKDAIEPAVSLVREALDECEASTDHSTLVERTVTYSNFLRDYYKEIKSIVSDEEPLFQCVS